MGGLDKLVYSNCLDAVFFNDFCPVIFTPFKGRRSHLCLLITILGMLSWAHTVHDATHDALS